MHWITKNFSTAPNSSSCIVKGQEGLLMFDLLYLATIDKDWVVCSSLSFLNKSFHLLDKYQKIYSDPAETEATKRLKESSIPLTGCSCSNGDCKDLNEKLVLLRQQIQKAYKEDSEAHFPPLGCGKRASEKGLEPMAAGLPAFRSWKFHPLHSAQHCYHSSAESKPKRYEV